VLTPNVPFPRSYWVEPGKLLAGCYPDEDDEESRRKLRGLVDCGIRQVVALMETDEKDYHGNPFVPYEIRHLSYLPYHRGIV